MSEMVIQKTTTIHRVGGSIMITLPKSIAEAMAGMIEGKIGDTNKKFHATIMLNSDGQIVITDIRERETYVRKK
jgi:antitoxin component of MazEF toxin-antitoxin module